MVNSVDHSHLVVNHESKFQQVSRRRARSGAEFVTGQNAPPRAYAKSKEWNRKPGTGDVDLFKPERLPKCKVIIRLKGNLFLIAFCLFSML
jgi:hypothetical protein